MNINDSKTTWAIKSKTILLAFCLMACGSSESEAPEEAAKTQFALCSKGALEADMETTLGLSGPGVDSNGALAPGTYVISATYLALRPGQEARAGELAGPVVESLFSMPGLVAAATASSSACKTLRTLTVWTSEQEMFGFVGSPAHVRAMAEILTVSRGSSNTIVWEGAAATATWQEAARQLGLESSGDR